MKLLIESCQALAPVAALLAAAFAAASSSAGDAPPGGKYQPSWQSLTRHKVPQWLLDAKFGIYAHWGVYSVPAFGNEWYAKRMYDKADKRGVYQHHAGKYGEPSKFGYKDLIPRFKAEKFDPDQWADLIARSGARYAGIAVVHHDGFGLWDSDVNRWNAGKMGPKRDLYGELVRSLRKKDLKVIATFHHIRTFNWYLPGSPKAVADGKKAGWDLFDPNYADLYWNEHTGKFEDFIAQWQAKVREVIDKYQPDVLWFDGGKFQEPASQGIVLSILSHYYNAAAKAGREVDVLNKLPTTMKFNFPRNFGVLTFEAGRDRPDVVDRPWIDDEKVGNNSWGYVEGLKYKSADEILDGLIDRVSRGGGLLLSLSPKADGTIPKEQQEILLAMGEWLKANGEAVYGTTTWKVHAEGPVGKLRSDRGRHRRWSFARCDAGDIRFTARGNTLYAIALGPPRDGSLTVRTLGSRTRISTGGIQAVTLLGSNEKLAWQRSDAGLTLKLPGRMPSNLACAFRIDVKGKLDTAAQ
jgi:alpha-L-fucosidase